MLSISCTHFTGNPIANLTILFLLKTVTVHDFLPLNLKVFDGLSLIGKQGPLGLSPIPSLSPWACVCQSEKQKAKIPRQGDLWIERDL